MPVAKVLVAMSGGVDSSVAALLLKQQGHEVIGATMRIWQDDELSASPNGGCCGADAAEDARRVADKIGIPHYVLNFKDVFRERVVDYFVREYLAGVTPNPCIACNRFVKWEALLQKAVALGMDYIATGHYAALSRHPKTGRLALRISGGHGKDQTYALYSLSQEQLERTLFPLCGLTKPQVREIAAEAGLAVANKPDSQEICFIPDNRHGRFIADYAKIEAQSGSFVDMAGNVVGRHNGFFNFTVGQRKNLGQAFGARKYVAGIDAAKNEVVLCDDADLWRTGVSASDLCFMAYGGLPEDEPLFAKIRYSQALAPCRASVSGGVLRCEFEKPQRAPTPGQAAVLYDSQGFLICGGTIAGG